MNFEQFAMVGEFVGGLGVLATLVFLLFEIRGNSKILKANAKTSGMESIAHFNEMLAQDEVLSGIFDRFLSGEPLDSFSSAEQFRMTLAMRGLIQRLEALYFQLEAGLVDEPYWKTRRTWLKSFLDQPIMSDWWAAESQGSQVTEEFVEHINATKTSLVVVPGARTFPGSSGPYHGDVGK